MSFYYLRASPRLEVIGYWQCSTARSMNAKLISKQGLLLGSVSDRHSAFLLGVYTQKEILNMLKMLLEMVVHPCNPGT